jgi:hypothetical protein
MSTMRFCAAVGLGLSLAIVAGCSDSKSSDKNDGGRKDASRSPDGKRDVSEPCVIGGVSYQPGQTFVNNCVTYTCVGGSNFTSKGSACPADAGPASPDAPVSKDTPGGKDSSVSEAGFDSGASEAGGNKDAFADEVGKKKDATPDQIVKNNDAAPVDLQVIEDLALLVEDTAPPAPDLPLPEDKPAQCNHAGIWYNPGESYKPDSCNTCICLTAGDFACTARPCEIDASP